MGTTVSHIRGTKTGFDVVLLYRMADHVRDATNTLHMLWRPALVCAGFLISYAHSVRRKIGWSSRRPGFVRSISSARPLMIARRISSGWYFRSSFRLSLITTFWEVTSNRHTNIFFHHFMIWQHNGNVGVSIYRYMEAATFPNQTQFFSLKLYLLHVQWSATPFVIITELSTSEVTKL